MTTIDDLHASVRGGDYAESVRILRVLAVTTPLIELARSYYEGFAVESIESIVGAKSEGEALYWLAAEFWDSNDWKLTAIEVFRTAIERGSDQALEAIGDSLDWLGAYEEAIPFLERARTEGVGRPAWIAGLLGHARQQLGDSGEEVEGLLRVAAQEHFEFGVDYANILRSRGAYADALPLLRDLVANDIPGSAIMLGNLLDDELDDPKGAIDAYRCGIEQGDSHSAYNLAVLYHHRGVPDLAKKFLEVAREMGDLSAWPYDEPDLD